VIAAGIANQLAAATPAAQQPGEQPDAALDGTKSLPTAEIVRNHLPDRLRPLPIDIALVGAGKQR